MKNINISKALKLYRKQNHLSVADVSQLLSERNISVAQKTIYGWESGQTQPDADTLLLLCEIYKIDHILEAFGYEKKDSVPEPLHLTQFEEKLMIAYRTHPEMHDAIHKLLNLI